MEVEEWQEARSVQPNSPGDEEEDEVVTFNIGGHHIPASLASQQNGLPNKENERASSFATKGAAVLSSSSSTTTNSDKGAAAAMHPAMPPAVVVDPPAPLATPEPSPACGAETPRAPPSSPALPSPSYNSATATATTTAPGELSRTPLGPSKSASLNSTTSSATKARAVSSSPSPEPSSAQQSSSRTTADERPASTSTTAAPARRLSGNAATWSPKLPTAAAAVGASIEKSGQRQQQEKVAAPVVVASNEGGEKEQAAGGLTRPPAAQEQEAGNGGVKEIVHAIEARTSLLLQQQLQRRSSKEGLVTTTSTNAEETASSDQQQGGEAIVHVGDGDEAAGLRRLSAGLSMRYETSGEHCPKYSQRELDIIVNKRIEDLRGMYENKMRSMEEQVLEAQRTAEVERQALLHFQLEIDHQLEGMEADFERRDREQAAELQTKEIQLKAVTAQFAEMQIKVERMEQEVNESRKKLEEAAVLEERLTKEWTEKLEAEKNRRRKDVQAMKETVTTRAKEQFQVANTMYWELDKTLKDTKDEMTKLATEYNKKQTELLEANRSKDKALAQVMSLEHEITSLQATMAVKDDEILRLTKSLGSQALELRAQLDKEAEEKHLAVRDREQALESLSRTAVSMQEYKRRCEELQVKHDEAVVQLQEHKQMCEELLGMLEQQQKEQQQQE